MKQLETIVKKVNLKEGETGLTQFLMVLYLYPRQSVKEISRKINMPIPIISAIKNEFKRIDFLINDNGIILTDIGMSFVQENLYLKDLDLPYYKMLLNPLTDALTELKTELTLLEQIYLNRPHADVTLDQSKCTYQTGLKRALYLLRNNCFLGRQMLCLGDDDLISVALSLLHLRLYQGKVQPNFSITVIDIDQRVIDYIQEISHQYQLPIHCQQHDLRKRLPKEHIHQYDCVITDPPYTKQGCELFISRAVSSLKEDENQSIFLSFHRKPPQIMMLIQESITASGLLISHIEHQFNEYEGAQILGGVSDMFRLITTNQTKEIILSDQNNPIYTGQLNPTIKKYQCLNCGIIYKVGQGMTHLTIHSLKQNQCSHCQGTQFKLLRKLSTKKDQYD